MKEYCQIFMCFEDVEVTLTNKDGKEKIVYLFKDELYYLDPIFFTCDVMEKDERIEERKQALIKEYEREVIRKVKTHFSYLFGYKVIEDVKINLKIKEKYASEQSLEWCIKNLTVKQLIDQFGTAFIK